ncbi:MAG: recombinase family protein [Hydrogenoanaerobacterium sp.]
MNYFEQSDKITEGLRKSFHYADAKMANRVCYGYTTLLNGELTINEREAEVVQWIFNRYLAGDSYGKIATKLEKQGILSPTGKVKWSREAISKLLSNEKYVGSVLLQKTMSIVGMQMKNEGQLEKVLIQNHHDAIISVENFQRTQELKIERSKAPTQEIGMTMSY